MNIKTVAFLGGHAAKNESDEYKFAKEVAKQCAKMGLMVVNGGGPGIMRASTEGAHDGGGAVMAVTTYYGGYGRSSFEGVDPLNKFDKEIIAEDYFERTEKLLRIGDVHMFFKGTQGTLSEFAMSWEVSLLHRGFHKPIILVGDFWERILNVIKEELLVGQSDDLLYRIVKTPDEAMDLIRGYRTERE